MSTHLDKTPEVKSQSFSSDEPEKWLGGVSAIQFEDSRPEAVAPFS